MTDRSAEDYDAFLQHPVWKAFVQHVNTEWGPKAYAQKLKAAVAHARNVGKDASQAIELVDAGNDAIAEAMRWPGEEYGRLQRAERVFEPSLSRRGGL